MTFFLGKRLHGACELLVLAAANGCTPSSCFIRGFRNSGPIASLLLTMCIYSLANPRRTSLHDISGVDVARRFRHRLLALCGSACGGGGWPNRGSDLLVLRIFS
jgi:hypothetical protein